MEFMLTIFCRGGVLALITGPKSVGDLGDLDGDPVGQNILT
jgi:hypothetical protein